MNRYLAMILLVPFLLLGLSQPAQAQNAKAHVRVLVIKASGKTRAEPKFDKRCKHLAGAFKKQNLSYAEYEVFKSVDKVCDFNLPVSFKIGFGLLLALDIQQVIASRYTTKVTLLHTDTKGGKDVIKTLLKMTAKSKAGASVVLGSRKIQGEVFRILIVFTVQDKPHK